MKKTVYELLSQPHKHMLRGKVKKTQLKGHTIRCSLYHITGTGYLIIFVYRGINVETMNMM